MTDAAHMTRPCENCPYRMDAPRYHWHRDEFLSVLAAENSQMGSIFACHKQAKMPPAERGICAGWLLDQKKRGVPSIMLRIKLAQDAVARAAYEAVSGDGLRLFRTIKAMCRANGVRGR
jgi:hypothetical protein